MTYVVSCVQSEGLNATRRPIKFIIYKKTKETASMFADLYAPMVHISVL